MPVQWPSCRGAASQKRHAVVDGWVVLAGLSLVSVRDAVPDAERLA